MSARPALTVCSRGRWPLALGCMLGGTCWAALTASGMLLYRHLSAPLRAPRTLTPLVCAHKGPVGSSSTQSTQVSLERSPRAAVRTMASEAFSTPPMPTASASSGLFTKGSGAAGGGLFGSQKKPVAYGRI